MTRWHDWSTEAFSAAASQQKPIVLTLTTRWSESCRTLEEGFEDPAVAAIVERRFVAVRVDAERRPDIAERYGLGGWPTVAFLSPDGWILGGGTLSAQQLADALPRVAEAFAQHAGRPLTRSQQASRVEAPSAKAGGEGIGGGGDEAREVAHARGEGEIVTWCRRQLLDAFDAEHGGFGREPKFPHVAPLFFALHLLEQGDDPEVQHVVTRTLDEMGWGPLYDERDGGFFRASASRDWSRPERVKLLEINTDLIQLYLRAAGVLGQVRYRDRAADIVAFVDRTLAEKPEGGFFASQWMTDEEETDVPTAVDRTFFIDANARMISAWLAASSALGDPSLAEFAIHTIERLVPTAYRRGAGVAHIIEKTPSVRGLLGDQIYLSAALLAAGDASGDRVYGELADELMRSTIRRFWDAQGHGFVDRVKTMAGAGDVGLLGEAWKHVTINCEAVRVLIELAERTGDDLFSTRARETLAWLSSASQHDWLSATLYGGLLLTRAASVTRE
jgi:uncharacterized protein